MVLALIDGRGIHVQNGTGVWVRGGRQVPRHRKVLPRSGRGRVQRVLDRGKGFQVTVATPVVGLVRRRGERFVERGSRIWGRQRTMRVGRVESGRERRAMFVVHGRRGDIGDQRRNRG